MLNFIEQSSGNPGKEAGTPKTKTISMGADHGGFELKEVLAHCPQRSQRGGSRHEFKGTRRIIRTTRMSWLMKWRNRKPMWACSSAPRGWE